MSQMEEPDYTDQFENIFKSLTPEQAKEAKDYVAKIESDILNNRDDLVELLGLQSGGIPTINPGTGNPWQRTRIPLEHLLVSFGLSLLSREEKICLTDRPVRGRPFFALGSQMSDEYSALAQGNDTSQPLKPRVGGPLTGDRFVWEFKDFADSEKAKSYLTTTPIGEFRWALIDLQGSGRVVTQPDIYREGDITKEEQRDNLGFLKNGATTLTVIKSNDGTSVTLLCGGHPGDTLAALQIFANERIIKELLHHSAKMHCFEAVLYITSTIPDHSIQVMRVPENEIVLADLVEIKPDERLHEIVQDEEPNSARTLSRKAALYRSFIKWGVAPEWR